MPRKSFAVVAALLAFVAIAGARDASAGGSGAIYVVDTTVDDPSLNACITGTANDCSFRAAIIHSNADNDPTTIIRFTIGTGFKTITVSSIQGPLPAITAPVTIDATTQICSIANPHPPCIAISGAVLPTTANGLTVQNAGVNISGLAIISFGDVGTFSLVGGAAIRFESGASGSIRRNFLGTADGDNSAGNSTGVMTALGAGAVMIGGPAATDRNVISGNTQNVWLQASNATLQNNFVGLNMAGTAAVSSDPSGNMGGIRSEGGNNIGHDGLGNVISGHSNVGIASFGQGDHIESNLIGTDSLGIFAIGNGNGINVFGSDSAIGGDQPGRGNVISGSAPKPFGGSGVGIFLQEGHANVIEGNLIGTNVAGGAAIPNIVGIQLDPGESDVTIGGNTPGARNVISGNTSTGIIVQNASNTVISGNYIGTNADGEAPIPNGVGIHPTGGASDVTIGGDTAGARNVISGNQTGIDIEVAVNSVISGNYIGTDASGDAAIPNEFGVIVFQDGANTTIGGDSAGERNVISGNQIGLATIADGTVISGNYIGTNASGDAAIPNDTGILVDLGGANTTIGGDSPGERNVISGNTLRGIELDHTVNTVISGNYIGLDAAGTIPVPNGLGIRPTNSSNLVIGGTIAGERNIISGNDIGIGTSFQNGMAVRGNYIGLNAAGTAAVPNTGWGVLLLPNNTDTTNNNEISGNVISGNAIDGVAIQPAVNTAAGNDNRITDNIIGLNAAGTSAIPNGGAGVEIGVPGQGTTIGNTISDNSIDTNGGLGIDIRSTDPIPNPPVLTSATSGSTHVTGTLSTFGDQTITLEFFASPSCDPSGNGEGRDFLAAEDVPTDIGGNAVIDVTLPAVPPGHVITATSTDVNGSTSEFSNCVTVTGATPAATPTPTPTSTSTATPTPTATPTGTPGSELTQGDVDCNSEVTSVDALKELRYVAELSVSQTEPCPDIGEEVASVWGDVDCNGQVTSVDALKILRHVADLSVSQTEPCPDIGLPEGG